MDLKKRCAALLCALSLLSAPGLAAGSEEVSFPDLTGEEWYAPAALELAQKGIMTGVEGGIFAGDRPVTRATAVLVLWRLEGSPDAYVSQPFPDTEPWFETAAAWAKGKGIAKGDEHGAFNGRDPVTREQLAVFFYRYAQAKGETVGQGLLGRYPDSEDISAWATDAMAHAVAVGILQGNSQGKLDPQGVADRAALAIMLQRLLIPAAG